MANMKPLHYYLNQSKNILNHYESQKMLMTQFAIMVIACDFPQQNADFSQKNNYYGDFPKQIS